jgi:hypothetical protein
MWSINEARARFEQRFPEFQAKARAYFADCKPEAKDEAVANSLFLSWNHFVSLVEQCRTDDALLTSTFWFAMRQTRSGRMMRAVKASKPRELWDHVRRGGHAIVTGLDLDAFIGKRNAIPDAVAFRIDTADWLATLSDRQRRRAIDLAEGHDTSECARRWGVSAAAVSLYRRQLNESYERFLNA